MSKVIIWFFCYPFPKAGLRETHHSGIVFAIPKGMVKTTPDCVDEYHGVPLAEEDWYKTSFLTEKERYQYKRVPQGSGSSKDSYTIRTTCWPQCLVNLSGLRRSLMMDDVILWSEDIGTASHRVCVILSHCSKAGMVSSPNKFVFANGFLVGLDNIHLAVP